MYNLGSFPATYLEYGVFRTVGIKQVFSLSHIQPGCKGNPLICRPMVPKSLFLGGNSNLFEDKVQFDFSFYCIMNNY